MNDLAIPNELEGKLVAGTEFRTSSFSREKFADLAQWANMLASSSLLPSALTHEKPGDEKTRLPSERIMANCFLIMNLADAWDVNPFALAQGVSLVHGKICFEGKIVAGVIEKHLGFKLSHYITGSGDEMRIFISDVPFTDELIPELVPNYRRTDMRIMDGTVKGWKTTGSNSPWRPDAYAKMLFNRGVREWARVYAPGLIAGVYTADEFDDVGDEYRSERARDVTPSKPTVGVNLQLRASEGGATTEGFSMDNVEKETASLTEQSGKDQTTGGINTEEREKLTQLIRQCKAASTPTKEQQKLDPAVVVDIAKGFNAEGSLTTKDARDKAGTITRSFKSVCDGKTSLEAAVQYTCGIVGIDTSDLEKSE